MPKHTKKCPECNGCMDLVWVLPNRYYYCDFCEVYYGGADSNLQEVPDPNKPQQGETNA